MEKDEVVVAPIDPEMVEISKEIAKQRKKANRKAWLKTNAISLATLFVAIATFIVAAIDLIIP